MFPATDKPQTDFFWMLRVTVTVAAEMVLVSSMASLFVVSSGLGIAFAALACAIASSIYFLTLSRQTEAQRGFFVRIDSAQVSGVVLVKLR